MKNTFFNLVLAVLVFSLFSCKKEAKKQKITIKNNSDIERTDEPIVISHKDFTAQFGEVSEQKNIVLKQNNEPIPSQLDDLNGDGVWDELVFVCNIPKKSTIEIEITFSDSAIRFPQRTNVRLAISEERNDVFTEVAQETMPTRFVHSEPKRYQYEGVGWENDKIGFRNYFDVRNAKDLFGKLTDELVLENAGINENYHELNTWGMDILHVGPSLGAGGLAMYENDSLIRLGDTEKASYKFITEGPVRAIFELSFEGWDVNDAVYSVKEVISIWKGKFWFESNVTVENFDGIKELAVGLVNSKHEGEPFFKKMNNNYTVLASFGKQSEIKDNLGLAIILPSENAIGFDTTPTEADLKEINQSDNEKIKRRKAVGDTYFIWQKITSGKPVKYYSFAIWEKTDNTFNSQEVFIKHLENETNKWSKPVEVSFLK